jgi:hypothetical protein
MFPVIMNSQWQLNTTNHYNEMKVPVALIAVTVFMHCFITSASKGGGFEIKFSPIFG